MERPNRMRLASTFLGGRVRNSAGEDVGKIEELVVDPVTGNIAYAVLSFGGLATVDKLFAIPWSSLRMPLSRDYVILDIDRKRLERAPGFERNYWPDMTDLAWQNQIQSYYGYARPVVRERKREMSVFAGVVLVLFLLGLLWAAFLVSTRGWEQARSDIRSSARGAAYAMKETSEDAALTAKVKTALALSKRIPANEINVDTENKVVFLRGEVPSDETRVLVESIARDTPGVNEVRNHLFVTGSFK